MTKKISPLTGKLLFPAPYRRLAALLLAAPACVQSQVPLPPINLGMASFVDADGGPGTIVQWMNAAYKATHEVDGAGDRRPGPFRQEIGTSILHVAHTTQHKFAGGYAGIEILLPVAHLSVNTTGLDAAQTGVGDVALGTFLQWTDLSLGERPLTVRADLVMVAPTGQYSADRSLNAGFNVWQLAPYVAMTWHATPSWEISGRLTYNWSGKNDSPPTILRARTVQSGQQASLNLAASYAIAPGWRIGPAAYRLQQLTDSKIDGNSLPGLRQRVSGAGLGLLWSSGNVFVTANLYKEFSARNRPEGHQVVVRLAAVF